MRVYRSTLLPAFLCMTGWATVIHAFTRRPSGLHSTTRGMSHLWAGKTMFDKIWDAHLVDQSDGSSLIYIDRHLVHEVTSPQAFEGLKVAQRRVRRPDCTLVTVDHNVPTSDRSQYKDAASFIQESASRLQVVTLEQNVQDFGLTYFGMGDKRQGIVHIIGPEQGFTLPGTTIVCGDSHTATHGAFGALAFGIGTSEVEHVLATQTLVQAKAKNMRITVNGKLSPGVTSKDIVLHIIGLIGTAGGTGYVIEFAGDAITALSMEGRMTICNMAIEAGARAGLIAPDEITYKYLQNRPMSPKGADLESALNYWQSLPTDSDAVFDKEIVIDGRDIAPTVTWGTSPQDVAPITGHVPDPAHVGDRDRAQTIQRALDYMGLTPGQRLDTLAVDKVFIGSCTNARIEDIRAAASVAKGRRVAANVKAAMVVPGSGLVKAQAEAEGLDVILKDAGFDWREPGCSMCLGMNPDQLLPQERCASTSNRNFEGRQGAGGRTHLVSPAMAAAAAVTGHLSDIRSLTLSDIPVPNDADNVLLQLLHSSADQGSGKTMLTSIKSGNAASDTTKQNDASSVSISDPHKVFVRVTQTVAAALDLQNVDTDMIIPKQFLKTIARSGLGKHAFHDLRYHSTSGTPKPDFVLNQAAYQEAQILVTGDNFGCGSSREHAPWALRDFGLRVIIAPSFADIFYNNCFKNGILPLPLPKDVVKLLMQDAQTGLRLTVDLEAQVVIRYNGDGSETDRIPFTIDAFRRHCLLNGLDDIGLTLQKAEKISHFEIQRTQKLPWLDGAAQFKPVPTSISV